MSIPTQNSKARVVGAIDWYPASMPTYNNVHMGRARRQKVLEVQTLRDE